MRKRTFAGLALAVAWLGGPRTASAATVGFSDLSVPGTGSVTLGATVLHDGFVFSSDQRRSEPQS